MSLRGTDPTFAQAGPVVIQPGNFCRRHRARPNAEIVDGSIQRIAPRTAANDDVIGSKMGTTIRRDDVAINDPIHSRLTANHQLSKHRGTTDVVLLDPELFKLFQSESFRANARLLLIQNYFPPSEQVALFAMTNLDAGRCAPLLQRLKAEVKDYQESQRQGRGQRFKIAVVVKYDFTCALTGYRLTTIGGANIVEAAHIQDWARSRNDDPHNGLALSRNAHWMFDEGLWSADDDNTVLVSKEAFVEKSFDGFSLKALHGRRLVFSNHTTMRPGSQYLAWHRKHKFLG